MILLQVLPTLLDITETAFVLLFTPQFIFTHKAFKIYLFNLRCSKVQAYFIVNIDYNVINYIFISVYLPVTIKRCFFFIFLYLFIYIYKATSTKPPCFTATVVQNGQTKHWLQQSCSSQQQQKDKEKKIKNVTAFFLMNDRIHCRLSKMFVPSTYFKLRVTLLLQSLML